MAYLTDPPVEPHVLKPEADGSSVGVHLVLRQDQPPIWPFANQDHALLERYIPGRELTVGVLGANQQAEALCVTEIRPCDGFYDYRAKYQQGQAVHILPAALPFEITEAALGIARNAHILLGCHGVSRADFRWNDRVDGIGGLNLLEINTQPGMTPLSLIPEQAAWYGLDYPALVSRLLDMAESGPHDEVVSC